MTEVFVAEVGQLTVASKRELRKAGVVVAEVGELGRCQFVRASEVVTANDMTWAALAALNRDGGYGNAGTTQRAAFVTNLLQVVAENTGRKGNESVAD